MLRRIACAAVFMWFCMYDKGRDISVLTPRCKMFGSQLHVLKRLAYEILW